MTKLELMTVLYSLEKLHEMGHPEEALAVIKRIIAEAEGESKKDGKTKEQ